MTKLEDYLEGIINVYNQYSVKDGNANTLTKAELDQLITQEMPNILKQSKDRSAIDKMYQERKRDALISLDEFINVVGKVLVTIQHNKNKPR